MNSSKQINVAIAFIKGFALILILSGLLGLFGCTSNTQAVGNWQLATKLYPSQLLMRVVAENSSLSTPPDIYKHLQAVNLNDRLALFQFNHPGFCGQFGCLHVAYLKSPDDFKRVWARYLDPHLPRNTAPIRLLREPPNGMIAQSSLPCLQFVEVSSVKHILHQTTECFEGFAYHIVEKRNLLVIGRSQ
ncbi:MAG: hypothetical protein VKK42_20165 [Lyngbya sp.]|nr:hypothetical protein [Lyngbya sp.]